MSAPVPSLYHWADDWFGTHRAYRVNRAVRNLRRQLSGLLRTASPDLMFEAAVLNKDDTLNPARNFTLTQDYAPDKCDDILKAHAQEIKSFLVSQWEPLTASLNLVWLRKVINDFDLLATGTTSDARLLRICYDHIIGLVTRIPVRGYAHQVLCAHYFDLSTNPKPRWYLEHIPKKATGEPIPNVTAIPEPQRTAPTRLRDQPQVADSGCELSKADSMLMAHLLPFVTEHKWDLAWGDNDYNFITIPIHTIHRWQKPTYGTFLGWLYVLRENKGHVSHSEKAMLRMLWPLLDSLAMELIEGELQDYLGHNQGDTNPEEELKKAIPLVSGWSPAREDNPRLSDATKYYAFHEPDTLLVRLGELEQLPPQVLVLSRKQTTICPAEEDIRSMGFGRCAHRFRTLFRNLIIAHERSETIKLRKYKQMLELVEDPLRRIGDALGQMQGDTQELRAVLYHPAKALFDSYRLIADLFSEDAELKASDFLTIRLSHNLDYDDPRKRKLEGKVVLAVALCRIFGRAKELSSNRTPLSLIDHAKTILEECESSKTEAFGPLVDDIVWLLADNANVAAPATDNAQTALTTPEQALPSGLLLEVTSQKTTKHRTPRLVNILNCASPTRVLEELKAILFSPFKLHEAKWNLRAIELAVRSVRQKDQFNVIYPDDKVWRIPETANPCPYHAILTFIADVASAQHADGNSVESVSCSEAGPSSWAILVKFTAPWFDSQKAGELPQLIHDHVLCSPRDWRITASNAGNFRKPFLDLATRLLGVGGKDGGEHAWNRAKAKRSNVRHELLAVVHRRHKRHFRVAATAKQKQRFDTLSIEWCPG